MHWKMGDFLSEKFASLPYATPVNIPNQSTKLAAERNGKTNS